MKRLMHGIARYFGLRSAAFLGWFAVAALWHAAALAQSITFNDPGTANWKATASKVRVEAWGGGGGGGAASGAISGGGGGGGGQYAAKILDVVSGQTYAIVVGAGGDGGKIIGNNDSGNGVSGGNSSFGGTLVVAKGGAGGGGANDAWTFGDGGSGGSGGVGTTLYAGGDGASGWFFVILGGGGGGGGGAGSGGQGGDAFFFMYGGSGASAGGGSGGDGAFSSNGSGEDGHDLGGGGGGAFRINNGNSKGGKGGPGQVTITVLSTSSLDHVELTYGTASTCASTPVTIKACMNSGCTSLYTSPVTVTLSLSSDPVTISGTGTALIDATKLSGAGTISLGVSTSPSAASAARCNGSNNCTVTVVVPASCPFDAVETTANPQTHLYTKLAGAAFNVDILALNGTAVNTGFIGSVSVDLIDASSANCPTTAGLTTAQTVNFDNSNAGRQTASFTYAGALKIVRVRMKGGSPTASSYVCSYDSFAIRPPNVTLATPGTTMGAAPDPADSSTIKAGNVFTLRGTDAVPGYAGPLALDPTKLTAQDPANAALAAGGVVGTLAPASLTVNDTTTTNNASYSEVGYLYLGDGAYVDKAFTAVDSAVTPPDCIANSTSTTLSGGMYGCNVGSTATNFGRFVPDHFATVALGTMNCPPPTAMTCPTGSGIAYSGQPLGPITSPARVPLAVMAAASGGSTTQNYTGLFAHGVTLAVFDALGGTATTNVSSGTLSANTIAVADFAANATTGKTAGVAQPAAKFTFNSWPGAPTDVYFRATETAGDGVTSLRSPAANSMEGGIRFVTGRLKISNATGSEKQDLPVPVEADYWSGQAWVQNSVDNVTSFAANSVYLAAPSAGPSVASITTIKNVQSVSNGKWNLVLTKPNTAGSVDLAIDLGNTAPDNSCLTTHGNGLTAVGAPWLRGNWCSSIAAGQSDPSARATFGIYTPENRRTIFIREMY